jgi:hypothetical protein
MYSWDWVQHLNYFRPVQQHIYKPVNEHAIDMSVR